jgi:hypothetical protein
VSKQDGMFSPPPYPDPYKSAQNKAMEALGPLETAGEAINAIHVASREFTDAIHREACKAPSAKVILLAREMCRADGNNPNDLVAHFVLPITRNSSGGGGMTIVRPHDLIPAWCIYASLANAAITAMEKAREEEMRGGPDTDRDLAAMADALAGMFKFEEHDQGRNAVINLSFKIFAAEVPLHGKALDRQGRRALIAEVFQDILLSADGCSTIVWRERPVLIIDGDRAKLRCRLDFGP